MKKQPYLVTIEKGKKVPKATARGWICEHLDEVVPNAEFFTEKVFNNLTFNNAPGVFHEEKYQKGLVRNKLFKHMKTVRGYGPDIFIYKKKNRFLDN